MENNNTLDNKSTIGAVPDANSGTVINNNNNNNNATNSTKKSNKKHKKKNKKNNNNNLSNIENTTEDSNNASNIETTLTPISNQIHQTNTNSNENTQIQVHEQQQIQTQSISTTTTSTINSNSFDNLQQAVQILGKAKSLDESKQFAPALKLYRQGVDMLLEELIQRPGTEQSRTYLREKCNNFMNRIDEIKTLLEIEEASSTPSSSNKENNI